MLLATLTVDGTSGNDDFTLDVSGGFISVTLNGIATPYPDTSYDDIVLNGLAGGDEFSIERNGDNPVTVNGSTGLDLFRLSPTAKLLSNIASPVVFNGGAEADLLALRDDANPVNQTITVTETSITRIGFGGVTYTSVDLMEIRGGTGADMFDIRSLATTIPGTILACLGGDGDDTFNVGNAAGTLDDIHGLLRLTGEGGQDAVHFLDQGTTTDTDFDVNGAVVKRNLITLTDALTTIEAVSIASGSGADQHSIHATSAPTTINAGDGFDTLLVTPDSDDLANIGNTLVFNGGGGSDVVALFDRLVLRLYQTSKRH